MEENQVTFLNEKGEEVSFFILEETEIAGNHYLLVADSKEEDANALILKEKQEKETEKEKELLFEPVQSETEWESVLKVFEQLLEEVSFEVTE